MRDIRSEVVAAHFRYGNAAAPLRIRAFAQLVSKALYLSGKGSLHVRDLRNEVAALTGGAHPARKDIDEAVRLLDDRNAIRVRRDVVTLRDSARREMAEELDRRALRVKSVLDRHFPLQGDVALLVRWLDQMCVAFLSAHSDKWIASLTRGAQLPHPSGENFATKAVVAADQLGIGVPVETLLDGFERFIKSSNPDDARHLHSVGIASFASRLVAAGLGSDPITTAELRGRTFLLDTNVLMAVTLEKERWAPSFGALGRAFDALDAKVAYAYQTLDEYRGVVDRWSEETINQLDRRGLEVVREAADPHIRLAVQRGCFVGADYATFFQEIREPPDSLGDAVAVSLYDTPQLAQAAARGLENAGRILEIQTLWSERRRRPKSEHAAAHDSALTQIAQELTAAGETVTVVTLDAPMQELALRWSQPADEPRWISLEALVQVLALDSAGPETDSTDFAPLLAALIASGVEFGTNEFQLEDLKWLDELEQDISDLPAQEVKDLAREIHRKRLGGMKREDPELRLSLNRSYQRAKSSLAENVEEARKQVALSDARADAVKGQLEDVSRVYIKDQATRLVLRARIRWGAEGAVAVVIAGLLSLLIYRMVPALSDGDPKTMLEVGAIVVPPAVGLIMMLWKRIVPGYRAAIASAKGRAAEALAQGLRDEGN